MNHDTLYLDVRTRQEYAEGRIDPSLNVPVDELRGRLDELEGYREIIVYCASGRRSAIALSILSGAGLANVRDAGSIHNVRAA